MATSLHGTELTEDPTGGAPTSGGADRLALVVAWWVGEPDRVGEVLMLPARVGEVVVFGRGEGLARAALVRQRPGGHALTGPVRSTRISREQLALCTTADGGVSVRNLGRRPLLVGGRAVGEAVLRPGDVVELARELVWVVAVRPRQLPAGPAATFPFGGADAHGIVGESPVAWSLRHTVAFCAPRAAHALVQGPSGSGKELVARALHRAGPDASGPFVSRNAATLPEGLVDAELFGNRAGYPNPGMPEREGLVGAAHRGTLFLDELGELPEAVQAHLLRVLDDGEYQRLGDARVRRSAFRLVGATNRADDHLKHDVLARLPLRIEAPGLNERSDDVGLLVRHLLGRLLSREPDLAARFVDGDGRPRVSCALVAALAARSWTTHVRELEAALWRAMAHSRGDTVELPPGEPTEPAPVDAWVGAAPADLPPEVIQAALDACNGVQSAAAERLGLASRYQLGRLIKRHGLVVRRRRE